MSDVFRKEDPYQSKPLMGGAEEVYLRDFALMNQVLAVGVIVRPESGDPTDRSIEWANPNE